MSPLYVNQFKLILKSTYLPPPTPRNTTIICLTFPPQKINVLFKVGCITKENLVFQQMRKT